MTTLQQAKQAMRGAVQGVGDVYGGAADDVLYVSKTWALEGNGDRVLIGFNDRGEVTFRIAYQPSTQRVRVLNAAEAGAETKRRFGYIRPPRSLSIQDRRRVQTESIHAGQMAMYATAGSLVESQGMWKVPYDPETGYVYDAHGRRVIGIEADKTGVERIKAEGDFAELPMLEAIESAPLVLPQNAELDLKDGSSLEAFQREYEISTEDAGFEAAYRDNDNDERDNDNNEYETAKHDSQGDDPTIPTRELWGDVSTLEVVPKSDVALEDLYTEIEGGEQYDDHYLPNFHPSEEAARIADEYGVDAPESAPEKIDLHLEQAFAGETDPDALILVQEWLDDRGVDVEASSQWRDGSVATTTRSSLDELESRDDEMTIEEAADLLGEGSAGETIVSLPSVDDLESTDESDAYETTRRRLKQSESERCKERLPPLPPTVRRLDDDQQQALIDHAKREVAEREGIEPWQVCLSKNQSGRVKTARQGLGPTFWAAVVSGAAQLGTAIVSAVSSSNGARHVAEEGAEATKRIVKASGSPPPGYDSWKEVFNDAETVVARTTKHGLDESEDDVELERTDANPFDDDDKWEWNDDDSSDSSSDPERAPEPPKGFGSESTPPERGEPRGDLIRRDRRPDVPERQNSRPKMPDVSQIPASKWGWVVQVTKYLLSTDLGSQLWQLMAEMLGYGRIRDFDSDETLEEERSMVLYRLLDEEVQRPLLAFQLGFDYPVGMESEVERQIFTALVLSQSDFHPDGVPDFFGDGDAGPLEEWIG